MKLHPIFHRYMAPVDENGGESGGAASQDRGDDFTPTEDDAPGGTKKVEDTSASDEPAAKKGGLRDTEAKDDAGEEEEGDEGDDAKKDDKPARKDTRIPRARHEELLNKERARREAAEAQLKQYQQGAQVAETNAKITEAENNLLALEKQYAQLLEDGKVSEAAAKMSEIRRMERGIIEQKAAFDIAAAEARAIETVRYNTTLERIEAAYPELNQDSDEYDQDKVNEVLELKAGLQARGKTPAEALQKAVRYVMGAPATTKQETAITTKARVDKEEVADMAAKAAKAAERKEAATKKGIDAALKTPPSTAKVGLDSDKMGGSIDAKAVVKMKYEDFNKLDEETLSRMRGDELV